MSVSIAGEAHKVKVKQHTLPQVPVLVNKKTVPGETMLVALDDLVISRARDEDKKAREAAEKKAKEEADKAKAEKATEEQPAKKARTS